jgi:hypothetical protein
MFLDSKVSGSGVVKGVELRLRLASLGRGRASMAVVVMVVRLLSSEISAGEVARQM